MPAYKYNGEKWEDDKGLPVNNKPRKTVSLTRKDNGMLPHQQTAVKIPEFHAQAVKKIRHPEAPFEAAQLEADLQAQRDEMKNLADLLGSNPEGFDHYVDQVSIVEPASDTTVTVEQVPAKKPAPRKRTAKKAVTKKVPARKAVAKKPARKQIETQVAIVPTVPVPPAIEGSALIVQED